MTRHAIRFRVEGGKARIGALDGGRIIDAGPSDPVGFIPTTDAFEALNAAHGERYSIDEVEVLPPVVPSKIIAIGLNYHSHVTETSHNLPTLPVVFAKWPNSLVGHGGAIVIPAEETRTDYEAELAVVFRHRIRRASGAAARDAIGAYCAFNDVSGRHYQLETPLRQFTLGKSFDTFAPMGPCLVNADGVDLANIDVRCTLSGEVMQDSNTQKLIFPIERLIEYVSFGITIEPGDVLITGTPGGVGDERKPPRYLLPGDTVTVEVTGCPPLTNSVRMED